MGVLGGEKGKDKREAEDVGRGIKGRSRVTFVGEDDHVRRAVKERRKKVAKRGNARKKG